MEVTDQMTGFFWVSPALRGQMFLCFGGMYCIHHSTAQKTAGE
jgi:hypothetical protein